MLLEMESPNFDMCGMCGTDIFPSMADRLGGDGTLAVKVPIKKRARKEMRARSKVSRRAPKRGIGRPRNVYCRGILARYKRVSGVNRRMSKRVGLGGGAKHTKPPDDTFGASGAGRHQERVQAEWTLVKS